MEVQTYRSDHHSAFIWRIGLSFRRYVSLCLIALVICRFELDYFIPFQAGSGSLDEDHLKRVMACAYRHEGIEASEVA